MIDMENMFDLLETHGGVCDAPGAVSFRLSEGQVTFKDVSFSYKPERMILKNISFEVSLLTCSSRAQPQALRFASIFSSDEEREAFLSRLSSNSTCVPGGRLCGLERVYVEAFKSRSAIVAILLTLTHAISTGARRNQRSYRRSYWQRQVDHTEASISFP
jgi:hypothetical protein